MKYGSEIEHLADEALTTGHAETTWLALRNVYFREGTPEDGWAALVDWFAKRGVRALSEQRQTQGGLVEFIRLTRLPSAANPAATQGPAAPPKTE